MEKKNVLVITKGSWSNTNNTGNTLNNFFSGWNGDIYSIACSAEPSNDTICKRHFVLPEKDLIKKLIERRKDFGYEDHNNLDSDKIAKEEEEFYGYYRTHKSHFKYLSRDILWRIAGWKSKELDGFLKSINVDCIFMVGYGQSYLYDILHYVVKKIDKPYYIAFMDDYYTLKQVSASPCFWIRRFYLRMIIRKTVRDACALYAISPKQAREYSSLLKRKFVVLNKFCNISEIENHKNEENETIRIIYAGNIMCGRYKTLGLVAEAVHRFNEDNINVVLSIYTRNPLTERIKKHLHIYGNVIFGGSISAEEVENKLKESDIVLHVESFDLHERYDTRLSFSTKIVDYLRLGKCIFAIGWSKSASMEYLKDKDAAVLAYKQKEIYPKLYSLIQEPELRKQYETKAYLCGQSNHSIALRDSIFLKIMEPEECQEHQ